MRKTKDEKTLSLVARALCTRQDRVEILSETETEITAKHKVKNNAFRYRLLKENGRISSVLRI